MNSSYEDKMYRQIEKSLSNNINDKLFVPIEMINEPKYSSPSNNQIVDSVDYKPYAIENSNGTIDDYNEVPKISRAEYILQAREACLRQMASPDISGRISDIYTGDQDDLYSSYGKRKRSKLDRLFNEGDEEVPPEEMASFRSLIIRTVCAAVVFLSIFIIDKVKVDWGVFSYETIRHYVTGNNQLKALEEIIVSLLK